MKTIDIVTLGELLIDMFPDKIGPRIGEVQAFLPKPGGAPANVAVAAKRLGMTSAFIGKVGEDLFGSYLKQVLDEEGVITSGMRFDRIARTTMAIIAMPDENSAEFVFYRNPGADHRLEINELDLDLLKSTKAFHFGSLSLTDEPARSATFEAAKIARQAGAMISYDVNYRSSLWQDPSQALIQAQNATKIVDLLKVNEEEAAFLSGMEYFDHTDPIQVENAALSLLEMGPSLVIVTLGSEGSYFQIEGGGEYVSPFIVEAIDAIGCGDAFVAGLLTKLVREDHWQDKLNLETLPEIIKFANAAGALTSLKRGAIPALPSLDQVNKFIDERN
jgi:fructokinase